MLPKRRLHSLLKQFVHIDETYFHIVKGYKNGRCTDYWFNLLFLMTSRHDDDDDDDDDDDESFVGDLMPNTHL